MYSYEDRIKAVRLYIKYDLSAADTVRELGYPSRRMLVKWYKEFQETKELHKQFNKRPKYNPEQMEEAVDYYLNHGRSISRTVRAMGYPCRGTLREWINELAPGERKIHIKRCVTVQFSPKQKKDAVIELCTREGSAASVAEQLGTSRCSLYTWKKKLLGERDGERMGKPDKPKLPNDRDALLAEVESLKKQIYRRQMELDILNETVNIFKKDQGIDPRELTNKEKASLIDALRMKYPLNELLMMMSMSKSSYFYQKEAQRQPEKYITLRTEVREIFAKNRSRYGYRRIHAVIKSKGMTVSE